MWQQFLENCKITQNSSPGKMMRSTVLPLVEWKSLVLSMSSCKRSWLCPLLHFPGHLKSAGNWESLLGLSSPALKVSPHRFCAPPAHIAGHSLQLGTALAAMGKPSRALGERPWLPLCWGVGIEVFISAGLLCCSWAPPPPWCSTACSLTPAAPNCGFCPVEQELLAWLSLPLILFCSSFAGSPCLFIHFCHIKGELLLNRGNCL